MTLVKVRRAAQITLPREIRDAARLSEGDYLEASVTEDGILLTPVSVGRREATAAEEAEEAEILSVVDEEPRSAKPMPRNAIVDASVLVSAFLFPGSVPGPGRGAREVRRLRPPPLTNPDRGGPPAERARRGGAPSNAISSA